MSAPDSLASLLDTIAGLGLAPRDALAPHLDAWRRRPLDDETLDEDYEMGAFLNSLVKAGILSPTQYATLLNVLSGAAQRPGVGQDPYVGQRFGRYVAQSKIGEGGMGRVYRALPLEGRSGSYVLKVFPHPGDASDLARIRREGKFMAALDHPHIVKVYAEGEEDGVPYLVMELVDGPTLQELIDRRRSFPWETATRAVGQIASALAAAHRLGIVHRDVKPHNVLVARNGNLKLCDFGLAKTVQGEEMVSRAGQVLGSPAYIAPEQWGDHAVDHRADLFAVGVTYYLLLTGVTPFRGRTPAEYSFRIQSGEYAPLEGFSRDVPAGVRHVVNQLLERDRRYRTPTALALIAELNRLLKGRPPNVPRLEPTQGDPASAHALVGGATFGVGSAYEAQVRLEGPGVLPCHAELERTSTGLLLRLLDPGAVTSLNGQRVADEVVVKGGDVLAFGATPPLVYREGNLAPAGQTPELTPPGGILVAAEAPPPAPPVVAPGVLVAALEDAGHPLTLLSCIEALDAGTAAEAVETSRRALERAGVAADVAARAAQRGRYLWHQRADWVAERLFQATHENLGRDVEAWLTWWLEVRQRHGRQLRAPHPRVAGRLTIHRGEDGARQVLLHDREQWSVGRSLQTDVSIADPSVTRFHAKLYRLVSRFAIQDLGSRLGTRIGGQRRDVALLGHGDVLELGRIRVLFEQAPPPPGDGADLAVDRATFSALVEMRSPHVVRALINLLDAERVARSVREAPAAEPLGADLDALLAPFLDTYRLLALEALPAIARANFGADVGAWREWLQGQAGRLPAQARPVGWTV